MPLIQSLKTAYSEILVWKVNEELHYFRNKMQLSNQEELEFGKLNRRKALEWISSRYLLSLLDSGDRSYTYKDEYGKPHLSAPSFHISMSHSNGYIAVIKSSKNCGIDIQTFVSKIYRIAERFLDEDELNFVKNNGNEMIDLHFMWGAKESLYKGYGKREIDFKKHLHLEIAQDDKKIRGSVIKENVAEHYEIHYHYNGNYMLVYAEEYS